MTAFPPLASLYSFLWHVISFNQLGFSKSTCFISFLGLPSQVLVHASTFLGPQAAIAVDLSVQKLSTPTVGLGHTRMRMMDALPASCGYCPW